MAKYCKKCGKELEDGSKFCAACGNPTQESGKQIVQVKKQQKKSSKKNMIGIGVVILIAASIVFKVTTSLLGSGYETPIKCMCDYFNTGDRDCLEKMIPRKALKSYYQDTEEESFEEIAEYYKDYDEYLDELVDAKVEQYFIEPLEETRDGAMEEYGTDVTWEYEITDAERLDIDGEECEYYIEKGMNVEDAYRLKIKMRLNGSEKRDTEEIDATVFKFDGVWTNPF